MSNNPEEKFSKNLSKLVKDYPLPSLIFAIPILTSVFGAGMLLNSAIYDNNTDRIESLEEENKKLKEENGRLNLVIKDVQELYNKNIISQTDNPLKKDETITMLSGGVIIKVHEIYSDKVGFEFSFEGKPPLEMYERWKDGSVTERVPFEYKGKSYFIVTDSIADNEVSFSVYMKK